MLRWLAPADRTGCSDTEVPLRSAGVRADDPNVSSGTTRFEKSDDEIRAEHDELCSRVAHALVRGDQTRAEIEASLALHQRMGDLWIWLKEQRRGLEGSSALDAVNPARP